MRASAPSSETGFLQEPDISASWRGRLISGRAAVMLLRNTIVSCAVFALGLLLLWLLVQKLGMNAYFAVAISFFAANSTHYVLGRFWIFPGSERNLKSGYVYFFVNAGLGLVCNIALFALLTEFAGLHYLAARIAASLLAGLGMFASNAILNFKSL